MTLQIPPIKKCTARGGPSECRVHSKRISTSLLAKIDEAIKYGSFEEYGKAVEAYQKAEHDEILSSKTTRLARFLMELKNTKKYHAEIGLPISKLPSGKRKLYYSRHAQNASRDDRYGHINLPSEITLEEGYLFEIETGYNPNSQQQILTKAVYRFPHDDINDIIIVTVPASAEAYYVKTVWINRKSDKHRTLDPSQYDKP